MKKKRKRNKIFVAAMVLIVVLGSIPACGALDSDEEEAEGGEQVQDEMIVKPDNIYTEGYDIVFCADNSGSVWEQQEIRDEALRSIANLAVGSDIRIGGVYFGDKIYKKQKLTSMEDKEGSQEILEDFLNLTEKDKNNWDTNIGMALEEAQELFENQDSSRKRIMILFSDGINENEDEEPSYKKMADSKTKEQAQILEKKDIPIYCVYLQKKINDEDYLKELVNYFDSDNSYDEERFKKVTESQINTLSEQFAEIFYSMQNDMKFKEISMDSSGKLTFYVPEMGVRKLQIYLKNDSLYEAKLNPPEGIGDVDTWEDGDNTYIAVQNPKAGDWTLEVSGYDQENTRGTIAYYADVSAKAELVSELGNDRKAYKNEEQKLKVHFFDKDGNEIPTNSVADVSADIILKCEDGLVIKKERQLKSTESGYESDEFTWAEYGTYDLKIRMLYEDFLDLVYNIEDGEVKPRKLDTYDKKQIFLASVSEGGGTFHFKTSELYYDPDGEEIRIADIVQMNEKNPVEVTEKNGTITVTAKRMGKVEFALSLKSLSGRTADVTIQGTVLNQVYAKLVVVIIVLIILLIIIVIILCIQRRRNLCVKIRAEGGNFKTVYNRIVGLYSAYQEKIKMFQQVEKEFRNASGTLKGLCEGQLPEELRKEYEEYLKEGFAEDRFRQIRVIGQNIEHIKKSIDNRDGQIEVCLQNVSIKNVKNKFKLIQTYIKEINEVESYFSKSIKAFGDELVKVRDETEEMSLISCDLGALLEEPVKCSLELSYKEYVGAKVCKNLRGGYSLDEIQVLSGDPAIKTLGDILRGESTGIYVYGYEDDYGNAGLKLVSAKHFKIRNASSGRDRHEKEAELLSGETYKVTPDNMGVITIQVEEENKNVK